MSIPGQGVSHVPEVFDRLRERGLSISMEPHLDVAEQFGGFTSPEKYAAAATAVRTILDKLGIKWS
jgi:sugar phosphate isomerase/epimerase